MSPDLSLIYFSFPSNPKDTENKIPYIDSKVSPVSQALLIISLHPFSYIIGAISYLLGGTRDLKALKSFGEASHTLSTSIRLCHLNTPPLCGQGAQSTASATLELTCALLSSSRMELACNVPCVIAAASYCQCACSIWIWPLAGGSSAECCRRYAHKGSNALSCSASSP